MEKLDLEIYNIWYEPFWNINKLIITSFILLIIFSIFFFNFLKKRQKNSTKKTTIQDILINLNLLERNINNDQFVIFYNNIIYNIKEFIFISYNIDYFSKTEDEILDFFESKKLPIEIQKKINVLILNSSFIKFANTKIQKNQMKEDLEVCIKAIDLLNKQNEPNPNT